jgi:hypothetical protein
VSVVFLSRRDAKSGKKAYHFLATLREFVCKKFVLSHLPSLLSQKHPFKAFHVM